jgi:hypothetical protein
MYQSFTGVPTVTSLVLTIIGPTVITLWLVVMGVLMWLRSARATGVVRPAASPPAG